jgi:hypothetical protein
MRLPPRLPNFHSDWAITMSCPTPSGPLPTALQGFVVARRKGVDLSVQRFVHDYAIADSEDSTTILLTMNDRGCAPPGAHRCSCACLI